MASAYARMLGLLAFATVVAQGVVHNGLATTTILTATLAMFGWAAMGAIIGQLAAATVDQSVRAQLAAEMAAMAKAEAAGKNKKT